MSTVLSVPPVAIFLKEGYIFDHATEKPVGIRKPEEELRREYEKILSEVECHGRTQAP